MLTICSCESDNTTAVEPREADGALLADSTFIWSAPCARTVRYTPPPTASNTSMTPAPAGRRYGHDRKMRAIEDRRSPIAIPPAKRLRRDNGGKRAGGQLCVFRVVAVWRTHAKSSAMRSHCSRLLFVISIALGASCAVGPNYH